jgi:hypothetical protein
MDKLVAVSMRQSTPESGPFKSRSHLSGSAKSSSNSSTELLVLAVHGLTPFLSHLQLFRNGDKAKRAYEERVTSARSATKGPLLTSLH